jgi:hypothetical protein
LVLERVDSGLIASVVDPPGTGRRDNEASLDEHLHVARRSGLGNFKLVGDEEVAGTVLDGITVHLGREVRGA